MYPRPLWDPIPDPPGPDPGSEGEFQNLANELMSGVQNSTDGAGVTVAHLVGAANNAEVASNSLGFDLAAGDLELADMILEETPDTLEPELLAAGEQDNALTQIVGELGDGLGESLVNPQPALVPISEIRVSPPA